MLTGSLSGARLLDEPSCNVIWRMGGFIRLIGVLDGCIDIKSGSTVNLSIVFITNVFLILYCYGK